MSRKTEARLLFGAVVILLCIGIYNLCTLKQPLDIAGTILFMAIGLVALCGLWQDMKNNKRWRN